MDVFCEQDFYSYSNWVELGNTAPFSNMIKKVNIDNTAGIAVHVPLWNCFLINIFFTFT